VKVVKSVYIYFISYFFNAGLSFVTISLLTHHLSPYDYGIVNLYSAFISLIMPFISCGILVPLSVEYYKKSDTDYRQFFTNAQTIPLLSVVLFTAAFLIFQQPLSHFLRVTPVWIVILPVTVWWVMNNEITMTMCRMKNNPWGFALFSTGKNLTEILLTIGLVIGLHWAWQGRLLPAAVAPVLFGILSIYILNRWHFLIKKIEWKQVQRIAWVSVPFIFDRLAVFVLGNSDKYFIDKYDLKGTDKVGLYSVGAQIAGIVFLVILSMNSAYQPYLFKNLAAGNKEKVKKGTWLYILAIALIVAGLFLGIPLLFHFFIGEKFHGAQVFAYYLTGGYFMWGVYNAFLGYLLFHGKNRMVLYLSLAGMIVSILLNFYMVPHYGAYGAAITSIVTYTFMAVLSILFAWKYFR
jgi:O-antigen/teichoic acid export membrane protein